TAPVCRSVGSIFVGSKAERRMRTNVFDRTSETKLRPINSLAGLFVVGNDTSANRVDSIIPDARITEQFGLIGRNLDALLTDTWRPVTAPPAATRRVTWALGTTKSPRWLSGRPVDSRAASAARQIRRKFAPRAD